MASGVPHPCDRCGRESVRGVYPCRCGEASWAGVGWYKDTVARPIRPLILRTLVVADDPDGPALEETVAGAITEIELRGREVVSVSHAAENSPPGWTVLITYRL